ncbi:hypothetical protein P5V15_009741 [Pogonomyrmex californicus]
MMLKVTMDSSSDEDDPYTNIVARLRAMKKQRLEEELRPTNTEQQTNQKENDNNEKISDKEIYNKDSTSDETDSDGMQMRSRMIRNRRNKDDSTTRVISRRTRGRRLPVDFNDTKDDIEILEEKSKSIPESHMDDVVTLSDDDVYNEDDNYEINIKVCWRSNRIDRLSMHRHDCLKGIFQYYANLEKVPVNEILIMRKDKIINHTDTPASLGLSVIDILDGGIVNPGMKTLSKDESNDEDACIIKIQTANKKQSLTISLKKNERFEALFANCAKQLKVKESNLKLYFDGEQISPNDTPESLDLEGEACVDLRIST